jgi:hypothetical protein
MSDGVSVPVSPLRISLRVFVVFTAIYLFTWAGHYTTGDGSYKIAWAKSMLGHPPGISPGPNGVYSKWGIGHSLLAIPPLEAAYLIRKATGIRTEAALYTLIFVVNGALFLALVAYYLARFYPARAVWGTVLIMGLATTWWPYTKLDFSEPLVLTIAFLGFLLMRLGYPVLGMMIAGFTLTIRTDAVVILGPMILWYLLANRSIPACIKVVVSLAPSVALFLFANYIRYHSLMDQRYGDERFSNPLVVGIYGFLFSSGKSIFLFSPPLLLGLWGWKRFAHRNESASDAWLFLGICVAQILFYAKYWAWSADDAWGPRYVLPGVLLLCIPMVAVLHRRAFVIPVVAVGIAVQLLAVTVSGEGFWIMIRTVPAERQAVWMGGSNRIDFGDAWFNPKYSQIMGNWIMIRYLLHIPPKPSRPEDARWIGTPLSDAVPPQAWAEAAQWDFIWNLRRSTRPSDASTQTPRIASPPAQ